MAISQAPRHLHPSFWYRKVGVVSEKVGAASKKLKSYRFQKVRSNFCLTKNHLFDPNYFILAYADIQSLKNVITFFKRKPSNFELFVHKDFVLLLTSTEWELADDCLGLYYTLKMAQFATSLSSAEYCNSA